MIEKQIIKEANYKGYDYKVVKIIPNAPENIIAILKKWLTPPWFNGYVILPKGHKYRDVECDDIPIDCHGGLTFSGHGRYRTWVIGFDCNHFGDNYLVQDADYVESECKSIIDQLIELEN